MNLLKLKLRLPKPQQMNSEETLFYHGRTADGYRFTIAGRYQDLMPNAIKPEIDVIMMGVSLCSRTENFVKRLGRMKAEGRMKSKDQHGRTCYSLYNETRPLNWFVETKSRTFVEIAQLNEALTRTGLMRKFNL